MLTKHRLPVALSAFTKGRTSIFNPNALFDFAQSGIPRVVEISVDSRREIDNELKRICEDFIMESSQSATEPISNFITQVSAFQVANNMRTERLALSDQAFATPSKLFLFLSLGKMFTLVDHFICLSIWKS
jgi:replication initiation and membrane attachment protein DnaB